MDSALDIGGPSEPSPVLPPLRAWRVQRFESDEPIIVRAHQLNPTDGMLQFITYTLYGGEPVGQISRLIHRSEWRDVEAITVQPEGASVQ